MAQKNQGNILTFSRIHLLFKISMHFQVLGLSRRALLSEESQSLLIYTRTAHGPSRAPSSNLMYSGAAAIVCGCVPNMPLFLSLDNLGS